MKLALCVPLSWPFVHREFMESAMRLFMPDAVDLLRQLGVKEHMFLFNHGFPVDVNRNQLAEAAIKNGADYLVWIDADMVHPSDLVPTLIRDVQATDGGVVSASYYKKSKPHDCVSAVQTPASYRTITGWYENIKPLENEGLVESHMIGMGAVAMPAAIFDKITKPWFFYGKSEVSGEMQVSEDVGFCEKLRFAGIPIFTNTDLHCGHIVAAVIDQTYHEGAQGGKPDSDS